MNHVSSEATPRPRKRRRSGNFVTGDWSIAGFDFPIVYHPERRKPRNAAARLCYKSVWVASKNNNSVKLRREIPEPLSRPPPRPTKSDTFKTAGHRENFQSGRQPLWYNQPLRHDDLKMFVNAVGWRQNNGSATYTSGEQQAKRQGVRSLKVCII